MAFSTMATSGCATTELITDAMNNITYRSSAISGSLLVQMASESNILLKKFSRSPYQLNRLISSDSVSLHHLLLHHSIINMQ